MDRRKGNKGTIGNKGGRPPKADEDRIRKLSISALESIYGSEAKAFEYIAEQSKESFPHLRLILEYAYGKPKDLKDISVHTEQPLFPVVDMSQWK